MDTSTEPCNLHELTGCSICSGLDKKLATEEKETFELLGPTAYALFAGKCPKCEKLFDVSTGIYRTDAEVPGYGDHHLLQFGRYVGTCSVCTAPNRSTSGITPKPGARSACAHGRARNSSSWSKA